jgi:glutamate synthase (NADPH/NADH) small chain
MTFAMKRQEVRQQPASERTKNFSEVATGFDAQAAATEAGRCLVCKNKPCSRGCPVGIDIPSFIQLIKQGDPAAALKKIKEKNFLPAVCGRVCPQEDQCEAACVLNSKKAPINIGALERFASDLGEGGLAAPSRRIRRSAATKVAVVGSGPAGLTCAAELATLGHGVTLFESLHEAGGVLTYGIPEFRLPKKIVAGEVAFIRSLGVEIKTNILIGNSLTIEDLFSQGYGAIFLGTGAGLPHFLGIEGEHAAGVYSANEFLTRVNLMKASEFPDFDTPVRAGKAAVVVGAGNVAMDSARCARRLGAKVTLVYRRTENEMPARRDEIENARAEGIRFELLAAPRRILTDERGAVARVVCQRMKLGEPDASGRPKPVPVPDAEFFIESDTVIVAIGQSPNPLVMKTTQGLEVTPRGTLKVDENGQTTRAGVFAGGDITTGADTVISAMGAGKKAARTIDAFLKKTKRKAGSRRGK